MKTLINYTSCKGGVNNLRMVMVTNNWLQIMASFKGCKADYKAKRFIENVMQETIGRLKAYELLVNLRDDYRIQYLGGDVFSISAPEGAFLKFKTDSLGVADFLMNAQ